jgi:GMP synthase-like glutamine amidotransferase
MRAIAIVHQRDAGPGVFADPFERLGWELLPWLIDEQPEPPVDPLRCDALLTFGGAMHADQEHAHGWLAGEKALLGELLAARVPVLGVCLGAQLLAEAAGAGSRRAREPEIGWLEVEVTGDGARDPLIGPLAPRFTAFEWHSYEIALPPGALALARSATALQAYRIGDHAWGIQFHAEVTGPDADSWIAGYHSDPDAVAQSLDWRSLQGRTRRSISAWNQLGRGLCERFLIAAAGAFR